MRVCMLVSLACGFFLVFHARLGRVWAFDFERVCKCVMYLLGFCWWPTREHRVLRLVPRETTCGVREAGVPTTVFLRSTQAVNYAVGWDTDVRFFCRSPAMLHLQKLAENPHDCHLFLCSACCTHWPSLAGPRPKAAKGDRCTGVAGKLYFVAWGNRGGGRGGVISRSIFI